MAFGYEEGVRGEPADHRRDARVGQTFRQVVRAVGRSFESTWTVTSIRPRDHLTIEGSVGSIVAGFACVFVLDEVLDLGLALEHRVALGLLLPPLIGVGDLAESAIKRALAVKDSSGLVPGHGGIADRLDSLLFAAPLVYYYLKWVVF